MPNNKLLPIQRHLKSFDSPDEALSNLPDKLRVKRKEDLIVLNYDIGNKKDDDCRGLILNVPDFEVVSFSFLRFYNYGDPKAATIDWPSARVMEKLDGSLVVFYHWNGWRVQTRGEIDAEGKLHSNERDSFRSRLLKLVRSRGYKGFEDFLYGVDHNYCVVCEYVGPFNRIVTPYEREDLFLLTVTDRRNLIDVSCDLNGWPFSYPTKYNLTSFEEVFDSFSRSKKTDEGYVIVDKYGNRVKVKNPSYLSLHHMAMAGESPTDKGFANIVTKGHEEEVKEHFPEYKGFIEKFEKAFNSLTTGAEKLWEDHKGCESKKDFALSVKHHPLRAWLFERYDQKTNAKIRDWCKENLKPDSLVDYFYSTASYGAEAERERKSVSSCENP